MEKTVNNNTSTSLKIESFEDLINVLDAEWELISDEQFRRICQYSLEVFVHSKPKNKEITLQLMTQFYKRFSALDITEKPLFLENKSGEYI